MHLKWERYWVRYIGQLELETYIYDSDPLWRQAMASKLTGEKLIVAGEMKNHIQFRMKSVKMGKFVSGTINPVKRCLGDIV